MKGLPHGLSKICAGFYDDIEIGCPQDCEIERVGLRSKAGTAVDHLRFPQRRRTTVKDGIPAIGTRQIIDCCVIVREKHKRTITGGVALEIRSFEADAESERESPMLVTLAPIVRLVRPGQYLNASLPIVVTLFGIVTWGRP